MSLSEDLSKDVAEIYRASWSERDGQVVPEAEDLQLGNDAVKLEGTVLYADMVGSTALVDGYKPWYAAEVYKAFLHCAAKVIRAEDGDITAYDGDRIMAVFIGDNRSSRAARAGLKINWCTKNIVLAKLRAHYTATVAPDFKHVVGIDRSSLYVARTGVRNFNDLVWVGRAANYAAKLASLRVDDVSTWISDDVFKNIIDNVKYGSDKLLMWKLYNWKWNGATIHGSTYWWEP